MEDKCYTEWNLPKVDVEARDRQRRVDALKFKILELCAARTDYLEFLDAMNRAEAVLLRELYKALSEGVKDDQRR
jgi:hypothetical protein